LPGAVEKQCSYAFTLLNCHKHNQEGLHALTAQHQHLVSLCP